jgi:hypothetical protein
MGLYKDVINCIASKIPRCYLNPVQDVLIKENVFCTILVCSDRFSLEAFYEWRSFILDDVGVGKRVDYNECVNFGTPNAMLMNSTLLLPFWITIVKEQADNQDTLDIILSSNTMSTASRCLIVCTFIPDPSRIGPAFFRVVNITSLLKEMDLGDENKYLSFERYL